MGCGVPGRPAARLAEGPLNSLDVRAATSEVGGTPRHESTCGTQLRRQEWQAARRSELARVPERRQRGRRRSMTGSHPNGLRTRWRPSRLVRTATFDPHPGQTDARGILPMSELARNGGDSATSGSGRRGRRPPADLPMLQRLAGNRAVGGAPRPARELRRAGARDRGDGEVAAVADRAGYGHASRRRHPDPLHEVHRLTGEVRLRQREPRRRRGLHVGSVTARRSGDVPAVS